MAIGIDLVDHHSTALAPVADAVSLAVTIDVQTPDGATT
jgi:hypothetical protein